MPPMNGRAGKFLEEERMLREYPLHGPIGFVEVSMTELLFICLFETHHISNTIKVL